MNSSTSKTLSHSPRRAGRNSVLWHIPLRKDWRQWQPGEATQALQGIPIAERVTDLTVAVLFYRTSKQYLEQLAKARAIVHQHNAPIHQLLRQIAATKERNA